MELTESPLGLPHLLVHCPKAFPTGQASIYLFQFTHAVLQCALDNFLSAHVDLREKLVSEYPKTVLVGIGFLHGQQFLTRPPLELHCLTGHEIKISATTIALQIDFYNTASAFFLPAKAKTLEKGR